jgi:hypothetical protein
MGPIGSPETSATNYKSTLRAPEKGEDPKFILPILEI